MSELDDALAAAQKRSRREALWRTSPVTHQDPLLVTPIGKSRELVLDFMTRVGAGWFTEEKPVAVDPEGLERLASEYAMWLQTPSTRRSMLRTVQVPGVLKPGLTMRPGRRIVSITGGYNSVTHWDFVLMADGRLASQSPHLSYWNDPQRSAEDLESHRGTLTAAFARELLIAARGQG